MPARRKLEPIRRSRPTPSATRTTSAPVASQTFAISLMKLIRVISAALAASLIISAEATSQRTTGAVDASVERLDRVAVRVVERADHDPVGLLEVANRGALGGELRVGGVADPIEPALVEAVAHPRAGADRHGALHHEHRPPRRARRARRRPSRSPRDRRRPSRSAACRRRRTGTRPRRPPRRRRACTSGGRRSGAAARRAPARRSAPRLRAAARSARGGRRARRRRDRARQGTRR